MTRSRYTIAAFLQAFGISRTNKRLADAAFEMHLMQDGEELLGAYCWSKTEEIEEVSMEYWNLRSLSKKEDRLLNNLKKAEETLSEAQANRAEVLDRSKGAGEELLLQREEIFLKIEELSAEREEIISEAQFIKRKYSALKMKTKVLQDEGDAPVEKINSCRADLAALKNDFSVSKQELDEIETRIETQEEALENLQREIKIATTGNKGASTESFTLISKANKDISNFRSELGLINEEQAKIFREIGRFLNLNARRSDCRNACKGYRGLLEQTRLLYNSIRLNRKLSSRLSD